MDRLIVITLLALGVLSYAEEQNTAEQFSLDDLVDKLADDDFQNKLVDKFVDRAHEKLNNLDLELEDTLLAKDSKAPPPPPPRRAPAPAPKKSGGLLDGFFEGLSNLGNSGGGVTPTVGRAGRGNLKNTGMTEIKALPEMSRRGFPQTVPRQNAFAGGARGPRLPFEETLAENDAETTSASSSMLGLCVMAFFVGMAVTYAAVSFRRGKSTADEEYKPM